MRVCQLAKMANLPRASVREIITPKGEVAIPVKRENQNLLASNIKLSPNSYINLPVLFGVAQKVFLKRILLGKAGNCP